MQQDSLINLATASSKGPDFIGVPYLQLCKHIANSNTSDLATRLWSAGPAVEGQELVRDATVMLPAGTKETLINSGLLLWVSTFYQNQSQDQYPWI